MNDQLKIVCHAMAVAAGLNYDKINWMDGTHLKLKWSESQEKAFKQWLVNELKVNAKMRNVMMKFPSNRLVKNYKKIADEFCFLYGFNYE
jgi:hypothetical protein